MERYYFMASGGVMYRFTVKAYRAWIAQSVKTMARGKGLAKISRYATNMGVMNGGSIVPISELDQTHVERLNGYFTQPD